MKRGQNDRAEITLADTRGQSAWLSSHWSTTSSVTDTLSTNHVHVLVFSSHAAVPGVRIYNIASATAATIASHTIRGCMRQRVEWFVKLRVGRNLSFNLQTLWIPSRTNLGNSLGEQILVAANYIACLERLMVQSLIVCATMPAVTESQFTLQINQLVRQATRLLPLVAPQSPYWTLVCQIIVCYAEFFFTEDSLPRPQPHEKTCHGWRRPWIDDFNREHRHKRYARPYTGSILMSTSTPF